jgi:hypothetical protein
MDRLEHIISTLSYVMGDKRKRHIVGGIMISVSLLFTGLALTVITIKNEEQEDDEQDFE